MRFDGDWLTCDDTEVRPVIRADMESNDGEWHSFNLLVDTGADRTVLSAQVWRELERSDTKQVGMLGGVGGIIDSIIFHGCMRLTRDDGVPVLIRADYAACLNDAALDMSVLGRDVLDLFVLIADRKQGILLLLGGNHTYSIQSN
jgi:predicted aspartyl protease